MTIKISLYLLSLLTCLLCTVLLVREYVRTRAGLLAWSALCFVALTVNNLLLVLDLVFLPEADLRLYRHLAALAGMGFLLYGFLWKTER